MYSLKHLADIETPHVPQQLQMKHFGPGLMKPRSYSQEDIAAAVIRHCRRSGKERSTRQKAAMMKFKYGGTWNIGQPNNQADLHKFFDIFNDIFFNGVLSGYCTLTYTDDERLGAPRGQRVVGQCVSYSPGFELDPRFKLERPHCELLLANSQVYEHLYSDPFSVIKQTLNSLAHEMLHAVFSIYSCTCINGCHQKKLAEDRTSHGVPWLEASKAMEWHTSIWPPLITFALDLARNDSYSCEVHAGGKLLIPSELVRLGLDIGEIQDLLKMMRTIAPRKDVLNFEARAKVNLRNRCIRGHSTVDAWDQSFSDVQHMVYNTELSRHRE